MSPRDPGALEYLILGGGGAAFEGCRGQCHHPSGRGNNSNSRSNSQMWPYLGLRFPISGPLQPIRASPSSSPSTSLTCPSGHSTEAPELAMASPLLPTQPHRHIVPCLGCPTSSPPWHTLGIPCLPILTPYILLDLSRTLTRITGTAAAQARREAARSERRGRESRQAGGACLGKMA